MGRLLDRRPQRAVCGLLSRRGLCATLGLLAAVAAPERPQPAHAQDGEEVIADPELGAAPSSAGSRSGGDEVISDPELGDTGVGGASDFGWDTTGVTSDSLKTSAPEEDEYDPLANTGLAKIELIGQVAADLHHEGQLEDAFETRLRFGGEIEFRRSRNLRLVLGSRVDFLWAVPSQNDDIVAKLKQRALDQDRFEVDVLPTAAYADMSLFDGFHLRVGQQVVSLGRMDFYSPTDMLVIYDLRPQPKLDPAASKLAQPAVRIDWDIGSAITLQAAYIPWFSPHLTRPNRDKYVATVTGGYGSAILPDKSADYIDPSFQTKQTEANLRFVGPAPDFSTPQLAARLVYRGSSFDVAVSAGTALEKIPAVYLAPTAAELAAYGDNVQGLSPAAVELTKRLQDQVVTGDVPRLASIEFHRYASIGGDFGFEIGPVAIGFEGSFSPERQLYAATKDGKKIAQPNTSKEIFDPCFQDQAGCKVPEGKTYRESNVGDRSIRKGVPVVQGAMHVEWVKGDSLILAGETFWINALALPYDETRDWWGFIPGTGAYVGAMLNGSYLLNEGQWRFESTIIAAVGPSLVLIPRIELRAREGLFVDVGAQLFEGPSPGYADKMTGRNNVVGAQNANLGGLFTGYDQMFVGMRWLP